MESIMTYAQSFFGWLMQSTLIASVVICLILLIQKILGGKLGPRWCHALWLVLLIRMILPWVPSSRASLLNLIPSWDRQIQRQQLSETTGQHGTSGTGQTSDTAEAIPAQKSESDVTIQKRVIPEPEAITNVEIEPKLWLVSLRRILPVLWLAGAIVIGAYLLVSDFALWRIVKLDRPLLDRPMLELFEECKSKMGIQSLVVVVPSDLVRSPGLFGFIRPRLLLPQEMLDTATQEEMRYVFLHELAHLKRHDIYLGWLTSLLQVLHWFNPLVWFAFYRMRADRELACDALVLTRTGQDKSQEYGGAIVGLVRRFSRCRPLPAMAGIIESKSQLKRRITMITQFKNNSYRWSPLTVTLIVMLFCVTVPNAVETKAATESGAQSLQLTDSNDPQQTGPVIREIQVGIGWNTTFSLSRDGSKIVYWRLKNGHQNLVVHNLTSDEDTEITNYLTGNTWVPVFSPDGKHVVYTWEGGSAPNTLHTVSLETGESRCLNHNGFASDWSRDGRFIFIFTARRFVEQTYSILSVDGEAPQKIDLLIPNESSSWRFSPDTKYISYSYNGNLYLYHLDDQDVIQVTKGSNDNSQPIWSPDGKMLIFLSRWGFGPELDLCGVPIVDGKVVGDVRVISPDFGDNIELYSLSEAGVLLYRQDFKERTIFSTEINPQTGQPVGDIVKLAAGSHPLWSPNGKHISYIAKGMLHVMSADGSKDREIISVNFPDTGTYAWSADNDHIYIQEGRKDGIATCEISISTKKRRVVLSGDKRINATHLTCSPDGKWLAFLRSVARKRSQVFIVGVDGAGLRQLTFYEDGYVWYPSWSPDGKYIAFEYGLGNAIKTLSVVSVDDGSTREIFRGETPRERFYRKSWSPDGTKIAWECGGILRIGQVTDGKYATFKVDADGPIGAGVSWSPDEKKMLFSTWIDIRQLKTMANFLPEESGK